MGPARIIVLAIAALAAVAAVFMMRALMSDAGPTAIVAEAEEAATVQVLAAGRDLAMGERLAVGDLVWTDWPAGATAPSYVLQNAAPDAIETYAEAIVRVPMAAGEPFMPSKVVQAGEAGFMAAMLTPGMRAVSVPISVDSGAGGFILPPNDRVDVLLTREVAADAEGDQRTFSTDTILTNVRVLAIDQTLDTDEEATTVVGSTATLELSPAEAEILNQAYAAGTISLALRSLADTIQNGDARTAGLNRTPARTTVQVYRYGGVSQVAVQENGGRAQ